MKDKREYYSKISRNLTSIALILFICLILIEVSFAVNIISARNNLVESQMQEEKRTLTSTFRTISDSLFHTMIAPEFSIYMESDSKSPEHFYGEIMIQQQMRAESPLLQSERYVIGISKTEPEASVVTTVETVPKEFFVRSLGFEPDPDLLGGKKNLAYQRDQYGNITDLLIAQRRFTPYGNIIIYIALPLEDLLSEIAGDVRLSVLDMEEGVVLGSDQDIRDMKLYENINEMARKESVKEGMYSLIPVAIPFTGSYMILSAKDSITIPLCSLIAASIVIEALLLLLVSSKIKENLYKPIEEAVTLLSDASGEENGKEDEFAFIIDNCRKIITLHEELENAMSAHHQLKEQQKYRAFIRGVQTEVQENDRTSYFALAYASVSDENDKPDVVFSKIDNAVKYIEHFHSIRVNNLHNAYIYKSDEENQCYDLLYNTLQTLTFHLDGIDDVRFSITSAKQGYQHLHDMFEEAEEIIQYRYRIRNKFILTESDIQNTDNLMNYSISDERMLVNAMVSDNDDAIRLFDQIVEKNFSEKHSLSQKEAIRFSYSLIGTLNRVFQEFKETPESLLGHSVDFEALYSDKDIRKVLVEVRSILSEIIENRKKLNGQEDDQMIIQMKEYINEHYMENLMLIDLSTKYNLTPKYCSTLFKKLSNDTFKNYLNQLRIEKACQKLEENPRMKIQDLSEEVGFQSSNTFIRAFSRIMGITPGTYAENILKRR